MQSLSRILAFRHEVRANIDHAWWPVNCMKTGSAAELLGYYPGQAVSDRKNVREVPLLCWHDVAPTHVGAMSIAFKAD